jgi:hypothetical protein
MDAKMAKFLSMSARSEDKAKVAADRAGKGIHDRPSEILLALLGQRDGLLRHPRLLANPRLCQPGRLAGRPQVLPELPEPWPRFGIVSRAEYQPEVASERAGEGRHDRPSEIQLALLGQRDGLLRHPCLLANPRLCQPGRLAGRSQVLPELPENPVRVRIPDCSLSCHLVSIYWF